MNRRLLGQILAPLLAAGVAIVVSSIALLLADESPIDAFEAMWSNIDGTGAIILIVNRAVPYYVAGVAVAIGFKMNLFNIGAAGQYQLAALLAAAAGAVGLAVGAAARRCSCSWWPSASAPPTPRSPGSSRSGAASTR